MRNLLRKVLRRLRGVAGTGLTWAVGWAGLVTGIVALFGVDLGILPRVALYQAIGGFFAGTGFALVLSIAERRHTLEELSLLRVAAWGAIGGLLAHGVVGLLVFGTDLLWLDVAITGVLAGSFATGSVALARREDPKLIGGDEEPLLPPKEG
jgi:hypothetical protein